MIQNSIVLALGIAGLFLSCNSTPKTEMLKGLPNQQEQKATIPLLATTAFHRAVVYSSADFAATWQAVSSGLPSNVQASFFEKKGTTLVMATDNQGIFLKEEFSSHWQNIGRGLPNEKINALHVAGEEIYAGVYRQGVYMSSNNGKHWVSLNRDLSNLSVQAIHTVGSELLVATDGGIFRTENGRTTWKQTFAGEQAISLQEYQGKIIAGTMSGVLLSHDGGKHWTFIHKKGAVHNTALIKGRVFAMYISGDVFVSENWGESWTACQYAPRDGSYAYEIINIGDTLVMSNNYGIFKSDDWGQHWEHVYKEHHMVIIDLIAVGNTLYSGTRTTKAE